MTEADSAPSGTLRKSLKRRHLFALGVGTIVGVAWLMVLGSVLASGGPLGAVIGFVVGAAAMIPIGLCYGELAAALPFAGGEIVYAYQLFGVRWAFVAGISLAFIYIINCVFFAVSVGWLCNELVPGIEGPALYTVLGAQVHCGDVVIGSLASVALLTAHWRGARDAARVQDIATYTLLIASCVFVAAGLWRGEVANLKPLVAPSSWAWGYGGVFAALAVTPYFFGGFNVIPQGIAELEHERERRQIAGILAGCILTSLVFYCLILVAVSMAMPRAQLLAYDLPVAAAFRVAFRSGVLTNLVLVAGLLGLIAVWNALFFAATRVLYVLGRSRLVQPGLGQLSSGSRAPVRAICFVTLLSVAGVLLGKGVLLPVVNVTSTLFAVMYAIVTFGVLRHRRTAPAAPGAYRVPGGRLLVWLGAAFAVYLIALSLFQQWMDAGRKIPVEWLLLLALGIAGTVLWTRSARARGALTEDERRRVMFEESAR